MASHFRCWISISASLVETRWAKECLAWLTRHKKKASCLEQLSFRWLSWSVRSSLSVGMLRLFSKGLLIFLSNPLSPTTSVAIPITFRSFLYEKFFYVFFGSSGFVVMQALNIFYVNLGAVLLYKLSQKHFNQKTADLVYLFMSAWSVTSPYFYSMYTDIPPLPLIALQLWWALIS